METLNLLSYDHYIVLFSGGKDCTAAFIKLINAGVPKEKIELWHHLVDGAPYSEPFMDWPCTTDYCKQFAKHFNVPIYFSWLEGGFKGEMLRKDAPKSITYFEMPIKNRILLGSAGGISKNKSTRLKFPQVTADLRSRWCSAYLKIDVGRIALNNQKRFIGKRTLIISGERAEESPGRATYTPFTYHECHLEDKRIIHHWMAVHGDKEYQIWDLIKSHGIIAHPCYYGGFSRCSCQFCIFGNGDQFLSAGLLDQNRFTLIARYEKDFDCTIKRNENIIDLVTNATPYTALFDNLEIRKQLRTKLYYSSISCNPNEWVLPSGAFGKSKGPS